MKQAAVTGMDPERLARIPIRMSAFVEKEAIAGAVTLVARHGVVASLEAVGYQDLETETPMRTDTIFQIRSMTKPVTAAAIMILMEEGLLGPLDLVEKHLPEFREMSVIASREGDDEPQRQEPSRAITIRNLLTHTSGIEQFAAWRQDEDARHTPGQGRSMSRRPGPMDDEWKNWFQTAKRWTLADEVTMIAQQPLDFDPDTSYQYSDMGFHTLGRVIEVVSQQPYERFIAERIFEPLRMKDSSFFPPPEKFDRIASAYRLVEGKVEKAEHFLLASLDFIRQGRKNPAPAWGMLSTASDLVAFYQMMLNDGTYDGTRILSQPSVELMTQVHTGELTRLGPRGPQLANYGLGWQVVPPPVGRRPAYQILQLMSPGAYGHPGVSGCFGWVDPKRDLIGIYLMQVFPDADSPSFRNPEELNAFMAMATAAIAD